MRLAYLLAVLLACSNPDETPDAGPSDARPDATAIDAATDAGELDDAASNDAEPADADPMDADPADAEESDAEPMDAEPSDAGTPVCMATFSGVVNGSYSCNAPSGFYNPSLDNSSFVLGLAVPFPPLFEIHVAFAGAPMPRFYPLADLTDERAFYQDGMMETYLVDPAGRPPPIGIGRPAGTATITFSATIPGMMSGGLLYYTFHGTFDATLISTTSSTSTNTITAHVEF